MPSRFEVCLAYWTFASLYHDGQGSETYGYLCRLERIRFNPGIMRRADPDALEPDARAVFDRLCAKHGVKHETEPGDGLEQALDGACHRVLAELTQSRKRIAN